MLRCFLEALGEHFSEYIPKTAECLLDALTFRFSDDVKQEATHAWEALLRAVKAGVQQHRMSDAGLLVQLSRAFYQRVMASMLVETDLEVLHMQVVGASDCIKVAGAGSLEPGDVHQLCNQVQNLLTESARRHREKPLAPSHDDDDGSGGGGGDEQTSNEQLLRLRFADLVGTILEVYRAQFLVTSLHAFDSVIQDCLAPGRDSTDRCLALHLAGQLLEKLGSDGFPMWPAFMPWMLEAIADEDVWVRQYAAWAIGRGARVREFANFADKAATMLGGVLAHPKATHDDRKAATEAATAALGLLCHSHATEIANNDNLFLTFLRHLPMQVDLDEAGPTHELLMTCLREGHPIAVAHAQEVCAVFLQIFGQETSTDALNGEIQRMFRELGETRFCQMQPSPTEWQVQQMRFILHQGPA